MNSKKKGNAYEQKIARELREHGWMDCETSRYASKRTDNSGIDFVGTGCFSIQAKALERTPPYTAILKQMVRADKNTIPLIFHKRSHQPETVTMFKKDAYILMWKYEGKSFNYLHGRE